MKAPFLKANLKAVSKRLIKAVKRLLYVVNMMNDCFKIHLVVTKSSSQQNQYTMIQSSNFHVNSENLRGGLFFNLVWPFPGSRARLKNWAHCKMAIDEI